MKTLLMSGFLFLAVGCAHTKTGTVELANGRPPLFLEAGRTSIPEVLMRIGEPRIYRELGNRSTMIYDYQEVSFLPLPSMRSFRLYLVFEDGILVKAEVQRGGKHL